VQRRESPAYAVYRVSLGRCQSVGSPRSARRLPCPVDNVRNRQPCRQGTRLVARPLSRTHGEKRPPTNARHFSRLNSSRNFRRPVEKYRQTFRPSADWIPPRSTFGAERARAVSIVPESWIRKIPIPARIIEPFLRDSFANGPGYPRNRKLRLNLTGERDGKVSSKSAHAGRDQRCYKKIVTTRLFTFSLTLKL